MSEPVTEPGVEFCDKRIADKLLSGRVICNDAAFIDKVRRSRKLVNEGENQPHKIGGMGEALDMMIAGRQVKYFFRGVSKLIHCSRVIVDLIDAFQISDCVSNAVFVFASRIPAFCTRKL